MPYDNKVGAGGLNTLNPQSPSVEAKAASKKAAGKPPAGKSPRSKGAKALSPHDEIDKLPHLDQKDVGKSHPHHATQLVFPNGERFRIGGEGESGSSKTAHDTVRPGALLKRHYVDLQTRIAQREGKGTMTEAGVLKELNLTRRYLDPHAVAGITEDEDGDLHSHLIMEKLPKSADEVLGATKPAERGKVTTRILRDVARRLAIMHDDGKVHLDIKPDNIRLNSHGVAMPIDFNSVGDVGGPRKWKPGNISFRAPQLVLADVEHHEDPILRAGVDVHSLGVTGLTFLAGPEGTPFKGHVLELLEKMQPGLDKLRDNPREPFTVNTLKSVCGNRTDASDYMARAYKTSPKLTETIVRDMLGANPRPMKEVAKKLEAAVDADRTLLNKVAHGLKKL